MKMILIVDDEKESLQMLGRAFLRLGYAILLAENGEDAMELFTKNKPDIVFLDYFMRDTTGNFLLKRMKEERSEVKIYFVTGFSQESLKLKCDEINGISADGYFLKPLDLKAVKSVLGQIA